MLKAGTTLCLHCGHIFSKLYYYNSKNALWVTLNRTVTGKYYVEQFTNENSGNYNDALVFSDFKLSPRKNTFKKGLNEAIYVDFMNNGVQEKECLFKRCCPVCSVKGAVHEVFEGLGDLPTYVVAVIGTKSVGKSCWIHALGCVENQNALANYQYRIKSARAESSNVANMSSTLINRRGETALLTISKRVGSTFRDIVKVLMLDVAGELFSKDKKEEFLKSQAYTLFKGTDDYSGVDAVIFMDSADDNKAKKDVADITEVYNSVNGFKLLQDKPVAYVLNKVDMLFENPPMTPVMGSDKKAPLFTADTFKNYGEDIYDKSKLMSRFCLEKMILNSSNFRAIAESIFDDNPHSAGFLIKTVQPYCEDEFGINIRNDYTDSINVMDPIIWILNELDIFPIV